MRGQITGDEAAKCQQKPRSLSFGNLFVQKYSGEHDDPKRLKVIDDCRKTNGDQTIGFKKCCPVGHQEHATKHNQWVKTLLNLIKAIQLGSQQAPKQQGGSPKKAPEEDNIECWLTRQNRKKPEDPSTIIANASVKPLFRSAV